MPKSRKSLKNQRNKAFKQQSGLCFYCNLPMHQQNPTAFASKYKISKKAADAFECTGEHLTPHSDGGSASCDNIVAACKYCNQQRHKRKNVLEPQAYNQFVQSRVSKGRWNTGFLNNDCNSSNHL